MRIAEYVLWQVVSGVGNEEAADGCKLFHTDGCLHRRRRGALPLIDCLCFPK